MYPCRSREGAWIEIAKAANRQAAIAGRSREGAWIEMRQWAIRCMHEAVAPVRERGLKYLKTQTSANTYRRSREGAWIEIITLKILFLLRFGRSREGAWIEIAMRTYRKVCLLSLP